jgi:TonB-dependent Receptor Plug Domain
MSLRNFYLLAIVASTACATAGAGTGAARRDANLITQQEIAASNEPTAYDVIKRLRPAFLTTRGQSSLQVNGADYALVYLDGQQYGGLSSLRNISAEQIREIRYYSGTSAVSKFGGMAGSGVIEIVTK